ncbi:GAF domain-containing protein, partial [Candidatus Omnitrophota bacterium]
MKSERMSQEKLILVFELVKQAHSSMDLAKCADLVLTKISEILGTQIGSVMLIDDKHKELFIEQAKGLDDKIIKDTKIKIGTGISGWVASTGRPLLIKDISKSPRFKKYKKKGANKYSTESLISVPLKIGKNIIGVVNVNNKKTNKKFTNEDLELLSIMAEQVTIAIQNARLYEETKRLANIKLDFLSNMSHELENPLSIIKDSISVIVDTSVGQMDKEKAQILKGAVRNIDRLNRLLDSLLDLARLESGKDSIRRSYIETKDIVRNCVNFIKPSA